MTNVAHSALTGTDIHIPYTWSYADATARGAATGFVSGDVGKFARQLSDNSIWMLTATTPTWVQVGGSSGSALTVQESDGSPTDSAVTGLTLPNGWISGITSHVATVAPTIFAPSGLTGATSASRYVGATTSGPPASGTFSTGDFAIDRSGRVYVCISGGSPGTWQSASLYNAYLLYQDVKTQSTEGGTFTSGAWRTRTLTTEGADTAGIGSLASNQITLPAGTYRCAIAAPAFHVDTHQARLRDVTNGVTLVPGTGAYSSQGGNYGNSWSFVNGRFTLAGSAALEVQHSCLTTFATSGFGNASTLNAELYTVAEFWRE